MKIKTINLLLIVFCLIFLSYNNVFSQESLKGLIIATPQNIISVATGDKVIINLGKKDGIVKGDILDVIESDDDILIGNIGKCAVVELEESTGVCEIFKSKNEAGKGDIVLTKKLTYEDPQLFPLIFKTLDEIISPYEPHNQINIYIHNIYDDKNNITGLSKKIRDEIINIFNQKHRIHLTDGNISSFFTYPDKYFYIGTNRSKKAEINKIKNIMTKLNVDVILTGLYTVSKEGNLNIDLYYIDKNWYDKKITVALNSKGYSNVIAEMVQPYKDIKEKEYADYRIMFTKKNYFPTRDEKREIIRNESEKDLTFKYNITEKKMDFNRIGVDSFELKVNDENINLIPGKEYRFSFEKGMKRIYASFQPSFFMNEELLYSSKTKRIEKEVILDLNQEDEINIEIVVDPTYGAENILIRPFKKIIDEPIMAKPVTTFIEKRATVEVFKD